MIHYTRLCGKYAIRLLRVKPGRTSDPIRCDLVHVSLLDKPLYEALSYTWGAIGNPSVIVCGDSETAVTRNLHAALVRFRHVHEPRMIWADAVCINQKDDDEKNGQIALMAKIYMCAQRGLIWLGLEEKEDAVAFAILRKLEAFFSWYETEMRTSLADLQGQSLALHNPDVQAWIGALAITPSEWSCLCSFFRRPWFSRVWIIQEAVLVANTPLPTIVACGGTEIAWSQLAKVADGIVSLGLFFYFGSGTGSLRGLGHLAIGLMERLRHSRPSSSARKLLAMLNATRESCATDSRDKIFSLHGLVDQDEANDPLLVPNYKKTCAQVYTDAAMYFLRNKSLSLLQRVPWTLPQYGGTGGVKDLPSWVPDWSVRHVVPILPPQSYSAGGDLCAEFRLCGNGKVLSVKGKILARLDHLMEPDLIQNQQNQNGDEGLDSKLRSTLAYKRKWYHSCVSACGRLTGRAELVDLAAPSSEDKYPTGESLQDAFWRSLICNIDMQGQKVGKQYLNYWLLLHRLYCRGAEDLASQNLEDIKNLMRFEEPMSMFSEGRRFCTTSNGYMGWVPQRAQVGDMVCIFKGSPVPYTVREVLLVDGRLPSFVRPCSRYFLLVGETYIHGFMDGEGASDRALKWVDIMLC